MSTPARLPLSLAALQPPEIAEAESKLTFAVPSLQILTLYAQRPIVEKHGRYAFYHPSAEAFASMLCDIPYKIVNCIFFSLVIYFMSNLRREPGPFFFFVL